MLGGPVGDADLAWARDVSDSLARLSAHAGLPSDTVDGLPRLLDGAAAPDDRTAAAARCADAVQGILAALTASPSDLPAAIPFAVIEAAADRDARRAAAVHGIAAAPDINHPIEPVGIPATAAGALIDALGRVIQDTVASGSGAIRVVAHVEGDDLIVVMGDRGTADTDAAPDTQLDDRRRAGLHAAGGCLAAVGGEVSGGVGSWGGVSVTLRVPIGGSPGRG